VPEGNSHTLNPLPGVPLVESPFFARFFNDDDTDAETLRIARDLNDKGFAVFDFPESELDLIIENIRRDLVPRFDIEAWRRDWPTGEGLRLQDAWQFNDSVRRIACNSQVAALLERLYGRPCFPFQTLNFPVGTQQRIHSDSIFFSAVPERFMCGVWLALEDTDEANGAANLLHGGSRVEDPNRTRWSQVTHYYFTGCSYFTPVESDPVYGSVRFREPINVMTGQTMRNEYVGRKVPYEFIEATTPPFLRAPTRAATEPSSGVAFDPAAYLAANPDVAAAGVDPLTHYEQFGRAEGRRLRP
jgi:hypothetical protein